MNHEEFALGAKEVMAACRYHDVGMDGASSSLELFKQNFEINSKIQIMLPLICVYSKYV
jgi:hypothetical protein